MKTLAQLLIVLAVSVSPAVFADTNCREEADKIGYVGPADVLPACEPVKSAPDDESRVTERIVTKSDSKDEAQTIARAKREQARELQ